MQFLLPVASVGEQIIANLFWDSVLADGTFLCREASITVICDRERKRSNKKQMTHFMQKMH